MKKIKQVFKQTTNIVLILFLLIIFINSLSNVNGFSYINDNLNYKLMITLVTSVLITFFIHIFFSIIDKTNHKKIIRIALFIIIFIIQLILISVFDVQQSTDSYIIEDQAVSIIKGNSTKVDNDFYNYFSIYKNNDFILLLNIWLLKLFNLIKIYNIHLGLEIFNAIMIDISLILAYKLAKNLTTETTATKLLLLNVLNPLNYLLVFWTYTCTYSAPFIVGVILLAYKIKESKKFSKRIIYSILLSISSVVCYYLRPIIVIPVIAILICWFINEEKKKLKKYFLPLIFILITGIICRQAINNSVSEYTYKQNTYYPITHWIMMGYHGTGQVTDEDNIYTSSFNTTSEKKEANIQEIKKTFEQYKISGTVKHEIIKLPITWSSGSSWYYGRLAQDRNTGNRLNKWIVGGKRDLLVLYAHSYRIIILLFAIIGTYAINKKAKFEKLYIINLTILGAITFYLIWEAKDIYSFPFLTLLSIIACIGITEKTDNKIKLEKEKYIVICLLVIIVLLGFKYDLTIKESVINDYRINVTNNSNNASVNNIIQDDLKITQEFETKKRFNTIVIKANIIEKINSKYTVTIKNNGQIIGSYERTYKDVGKDGLIGFKIPENKGSPGKYTIEISSKENSLTSKKDKGSPKRDSLSWVYIKTLELDNYKGNLKIGNSDNKGDLYIRVYQKKKSKYMNSRLFYLLYIIALLIMIIEYKNIYNKKGDKNEKE